MMCWVPSVEESLTTTIFLGSKDWETNESNVFDRNASSLCADFIDRICKLLSLDNPPARFFQKPIELPIFEFVIVAVPHIGFTSIGRCKPQSQRHRGD